MKYTKVKNNDAIPESIWRLAEKQAQRSTLHTFRTGAVIFDSDFQVLSKGTSHHSEVRSHTTHAEAHATSEMRKVDTDVIYGHSILIVTLGKRGNYSYSSCPCAYCARMLMDYVGTVFYAERNLSSDEWRLSVETPFALLSRVSIVPKELRNYARDMRIPNE